MRGRRAAAAGLAVALVAAAVVARSGAAPSDTDAQDAPAQTAPVTRGRLSAMISQDGILTYRARPDGSPFPVVNQAGGVYTQLPETGDRIGCGEVLYRVDDRPVLLLCGRIPAYRTLRRGRTGPDARQLNRVLRQRGYAAAAQVRLRPGEASFTARTAQALKMLQRRRGLRATGVLRFGDVVFAPAPLRVAKLSAGPGAPARPGAPVLEATSDRLIVQVNLEPSQQGAVERGDRAQITLPGARPVSGRVTGFGTIARIPAGPDGAAADATIPTAIALDDPSTVRGLDQAPVGVQITTDGVDDALSVPVTALVGRSGGGFAVEVVRAGGRRALVAVTLGLFDTGGGRVQVTGGVREGDAVVVPSL